MKNVRFINNQARYYFLFHKKDKTRAERKEFVEICGDLMDEILNNNKEILERLKDRK